MGMIMPKNHAIPKGVAFLQQKENQTAVNLRVERKMENPVVGNVSLVAIKRNHVREMNVKNRIPVPRKILPAKKEKNPVPIKKRTVLRKNGRSNFSSSPFFLSLKFLS